MFFWNFFIRLILELYYPMLLVALVTLYTSEKPSKQVSQMIQVAILVGFVIFTFFFMRKHQNNVENKEFKDKFGAYMTNIETYKRPQAVHFSFVFMLRRLILALNITFLKINLVTQVLISVHCSLAILSWLIIVWPFDSDFKNYLECFNESIVLVMSYLGFLLSDFVESPISRYNFGYLFIGVIGFGLLVNIIVMGGDAVIGLIKWCRMRKLKQTAKTQTTVAPFLTQAEPFKTVEHEKP